MTEYTENIGGASAYYHICNSGISITIDKQEIFRDDENEPYNVTPVLRISGSAYGIQMGDIKIPVRPADLILLGNWLISEAENASDYYVPGSNEFEFRLESNLDPNVRFNAKEDGTIYIERKDQNSVNGCECNMSNDLHNDNGDDECCISEPELSPLVLSAIRTEALNMANGKSNNITELLQNAKAIEKYLLG